MTGNCAYAGCNKQLARRMGEKKFSFQKRKYCNRECSYKNQSTNRRRPVNHGTPSGYNVHLRRGERPCTPCHDARLEWQRARYPTMKKASAQKVKARRRAMNELIAEHYEEYQLLVKTQYEQLSV